MMEITLIAAMSMNFVIGRRGELPWKLPADLKRFKALTMGHVVVMGRKTYESLESYGVGPLMGRTNVVLTRDVEFKSKWDYVIVLHSMKEVIQRFEGKDEIFIIGGGEIYKQFLPLANSIYLTVVDTVVDDGDAYFPAISYLDNEGMGNDIDHNHANKSGEWQQVSRVDHKADEKNAYAYSFIELARRI